jgi:DnaK suppressor protein
MTRIELDRYKDALEAKRADVSAALCRREDIAIEKVPDTLDEVQFACERELAIRNLDRDSGLLRRIRAAIQRIHDGSYGVCLRCEEPIRPRRLEAVPWAELCLHCQESADRSESGQGRADTPDELLTNAA